MKAIVSKELCIGCGACTSVCPALFELGDDYIAKVLAEDISEKDQNCAQDAADVCPVGAITIE